jgi:hypothetical protein
MQSLVVYWLHLRFDLRRSAQALFFGTSLLSRSRSSSPPGWPTRGAAQRWSSPALERAAARGAVHAELRARPVLLARHLLSQMDVPTRQAYAMALVARSAAAGSR